MLSCNAWQYFFLCFCFSCGFCCFYPHPEVEIASYCACCCGYFAAWKLPVLMVLLLILLLFAEPHIAVPCLTMSLILFFHFSFCCCSYLYPDKEIMVHSGFLSAYDSVRAKVLSLVDTLTRDASPGDPWVVFVTGHSLGGALATLCAYEMAGRR
jgi:hypothetical protein